MCGVYVYVYVVADGDLRLDTCGERRNTHVVWALVRVQSVSFQDV